MKNYDYIVVGAGLSGVTVAECLARRNKRILMIEKRDHIGGNCFDCYQDGVLIHKYGPHIFHTDKKKVWDYLSRFTEWNEYRHKVKCSIDGDIVPFPVNFNTIEKDCIKILCDKFKGRDEISIVELENSKEDSLRILAYYIWKTFYKNYTLKQWGLGPKDLPDEILGRVPIRLNYNDEYFTDKYQGIPANGYSEMFNRMVDNKNIEIELNAVNWRNYYNIFEKTNIIYTGRIDESFRYRFGELPYRSLDFKYKTIAQEYYQDCAVVNYPNHRNMTRITEFKIMTGQNINKTIIAKEYPKACKKNDIPYYPIPNADNIELYNKYKTMADKTHNLILLGRLAEYKYYDMDDAVDRALRMAEKIA